MLITDQPLALDSAPTAFAERLCEHLSASGLVRRADLARAERLADQVDSALPPILLSMGLLSESALAKTYSEVLNIPLIAATDLPQTPLQFEELAPRFLLDRKLLPVSQRPEGVLVAMADPFDEYALRAFRLATGLRPLVCVAEPAAIERAIERLYEIELSEKTERFEALALDGGDELEIERLKDLANEAPVVQLLNSLIAQAVEQRASDIHFEPFENEFRVRFRVDGVLQEAKPLPYQLRPAIISRIKIMAQLDIAERRLPQDGRIRTAIRGKSIDLRVSTLQTLHGESVVMRLLHRESVDLHLDALGIQGHARKVLDEVLARPDGIFLVTGPTGSGKTTSLYAALSQINDPGRKIITVEDPVEYELAGVNQVQVQPDIGLGFADVLRTMLRQDPDVVLVGEIRDGETARIATQAALTGHLVLSTLHTNNASSALTRLVDLGVEEYILTSAITAVASQRLVRRLCPECKEAYAPSDELISRFNLDRTTGGGTIQLFRPVGCEACQGAGYRGRTAVIEAIRITEKIRSLVLRRAEAWELHQAAVDEGTVPMFDDAVAKALAGISTLEEAVRTTREQ